MFTIRCNKRVGAIRQVTIFGPRASVYFRLFWQLTPRQVNRRSVTVTWQVAGIYRIIIGNVDRLHRIEVNGTVASGWNVVLIDARSLLTTAL